MATSSLPRRYNVVLAAVLLLTLPCAYALNTSDYAVQVSASVSTSPASVTLSWPVISDATNYSVSRKAVADTTWGTATSVGMATTYADSSVSVGSTYEYRVVKSGSSATSYGYICVALQAPLVESRGKVLLVVENTYAVDLATELTRLQADLVGDGWTVIVRQVARTDTVVSVKSVITTEYNADPSNLKSVFLFGRVPVPYSGNTNPDGHPDHQGAWPTDTFYADVNGTWTDTSVNNTVASRNENDNIPGDGKYDQSYIPSNVELQVGRVDLCNMPAFAPKTELDLLRQYLNKDHNFRHKLITAERRGLIDDNFGVMSGEAFAASGWRNFSAFFGAGNVSEVDWFGTLSSDSYLWAYGTGGGNYQGAGGVGSTSNFASTDTKTVFTMLFGSYFGDWDVNDSFLRAPLATTTYGLTCAWAGRPHWYFHHMGAGYPVGYSARVTQNNNGLYSPTGYGGRGVHVNLMGDPTLRMHIVAPPSGLLAERTTSVALTWDASAETVLGYHVYRSASAQGPFARLTASLVTGTSYTDASPPAGSLVYMVRAVNLESTTCGSYYNASQGVFAAASAPPTTPPAAPTSLTATSNSATRVNLSWTDNADNEARFLIERKTGVAGTWVEIASVGADTTVYADTPVSSSTQYVYRVRAHNSIGDSAYSNEASATTSDAVGDGSGTGLTGEYYDNMDLTALALTRVDATVNFDYGNGAPSGTTLGVDTFSIRWSGQVQPRYGETYTFHVTTDDGVRLWVNGVQLVNNWVDQAPTERSGTIALSAGVKYDIVMEYYENGGGAAAKLSWSSSSEAKAIIPQSQLYPLGAPAIPGVPTRLAATAASSTRVDLNWTDNASNETGFRIERKTGAGGSWSQIGTVGASLTSYADTTVSASTTYYYRVCAYNGNGNSAYSNESNATTPAVPSVPAAPTNLLAAAASSIRVDLSWTDHATNETEFRIERKTGSGGTWAQIAAVGANVVAYADTTVAPGTLYVYRVCAHSDSGDSAYSNEAGATTPTSSVSAPTNLIAAAASAMRVDLAWRDNSTNETEFRIERRTGTAGSWDEIATVGADVTSYADTAVVAATTYCYRVRAHNDTGDSAFSNEANVTTPPPPPPPAAPSGLTATVVSGGRIDLSWTDNAGDETEFRIERRSGADGAWTLVAVAGANVAAYSDSGLTPSTQYSYRVCAAGSNGASAYSNEVSATTASNSSPSITSGVTASPTTVLTGQTVTFSVGASDPDGNPLSCSWDFGDGSPASATASHVYTTAGNYTVTVTITDTNGGAQTSTMKLTVAAAADNADSDNDGVSDSNEIADGTDPFSATSYAKAPMYLAKIKGGVRFDQQGRDGVAVSGVIPNVPASFTPANQIVTLDVGGVVREFKLNAKGAARTADGSFQMKLKMKHNKTTKKTGFVVGNVPFKASVLRTSCAPAWLDEGVDPAANAKKAALPMTVDLKFNGRIYTASIATLYSAKAGKSGAFSGKNKNVPKK